MDFWYVAPQGAVPPLSGAPEKPRVAASAQGLELSEELRDWIREFSTREGTGAVSMLNLLAFKPGMKGSYLEYGKVFAESVGSRRGGVAKIIGTVVGVNGRRKVEAEAEVEVEAAEDWDEVALAHYPSILHFAVILASEDYQEINRKFMSRR